MPKTKIAKKIKIISSISFWQDKTRVSLFICISVNVEKSISLLVFKRKHGDKKEYLLKQNSNVLEKKVLVYCEENSWIDKNIILLWLANIFFKIYTNNKKKEIYLILERAIINYEENLAKTFDNNNSSNFLILPD